MELRAASRALPNAEELLAIPASVSMPAPSGCRGRCAPTRKSITPSSRASPGGWRRSFCAATSSAAGPARRLHAASRTALKTYRLTHLTRIARARDRVTTSPNAPSARPDSARQPRCAAGALRAVAPRLFLSRRAVSRLRAGARRRAIRCARLPRCSPACRSTSSSPTAASAQPHRA